MATKSTSKAMEEQGEAAVQPADAEKTENSAANAQVNETPEEKQHDEQTAAETQKTSSDPEKDVEAGEPEISEPAVPELESISQLANNHRVPGWQLAALLRFTGWTDDRQVSEEEFVKALSGLKNRRMGGGRR